MRATTCARCACAGSACAARAALSLVYSHATRDVTRNLARDEALAAIAALLDPAATPSFGARDAAHGAAETQLLVSRKGRSTLRRWPHADRPRRASTLPPCRRTIASASAGCRPTCRSCARSGSATSTGRVVPAQARKWRQIDKFLEVLDHALADLPAPTTGRWRAPGAIRVVDFGCGKGYLTFAVHEHLRRRFGGAPQVTGVELRPELVAVGQRRRRALRLRPASRSSPATCARSRRPRSTS